MSKNLENAVPTPEIYSFTWFANERAFYGLNLVFNGISSIVMTTAKSGRSQIINGYRTA